MTRDRDKDITVRLTPVQREALEYVFRAHPDSVHHRDRHPEEYVRMISRKGTIDALEKKGLTERAYQDFPDGYHAKLTEHGRQVRAKLVAAREEEEGQAAARRVERWARVRTRREAGLP